MGIQASLEYLERCSNYVGHIEREPMLEDRPRVEEAVAEVARRRGYAVQQSADAFAGRKLYLRYRSVLGQPPLPRPDRGDGDANPVAAR